MLRFANLISDRKLSQQPPQELLEAMGMPIPPALASAQTEQVSQN
ncbi:MAG TPA: hypothetical protein V6D35_10590 [Candidatus Sericytochromatia bacterium]